MFDALEGPGSDINLYGYSYGTLLAFWVTQMFPERSGKVILDGVVDPSDWALYQPYLGWDLDIADTEATYKGFTQACAAAGPSGCNFSSSATETAADIDARVEHILSSVYATWNDPTKYSQNEITEKIFSYLYQVC
jgi:pimeloyl-ACP methyl ester carboxylesterase